MRVVEDWGRVAVFVGWVLLIALCVSACDRPQEVVDATGNVVGVTYDDDESDVWTVERQDVRLSVSRWTGRAVDQRMVLFTDDPGGRARSLWVSLGSKCPDRPPDTVMLAGGLMYEADAKNMGIRKMSHVYKGGVAARMPSGLQRCFVRLRMRVRDRAERFFFPPPLKLRELPEREVEL